MKSNSILLGCTLWLFSTLASAQIGEIYTYPHYVSNPQDHIVVQNGRPTMAPYVNHIPQLILRHLGHYSASNNITYDVGYYTGFHTTSQYQFGLLDQGPPVGTSAIQLKGTRAGCMINTWQFDWIPVEGGGPNCVYQYRYDTSQGTAPRPWTTPGQSLTFQFYHKLPQFYRSSASEPNKAIGQSSMAIYLKADSGDSIAVLANLYDMRGSFQPYVAHDTFTVFVSAPLEDNSTPGACPFFSKSAYSSSFSATPWRDERFFRMHITEENLDCIIAAGRSRGLDLPTDRTKWQVDAWLWLMEIVGHSPNANASLGGSIRDPYLLTCTGVNC